jgi:predicted lipoprotein with Yx(FWY)xxD motif
MVAGLLALPGCGGDDESGPSTTSNDAGATATTPPSKRAPSEKSAPAGTTITVGGSEFGTMLFGSDKQAIYIFQRDSKGKTVCYGECADAWPPVFTKGTPKAGRGVKQSLLATVKRRDGKLQVTYAGQPLYFYAHEGAGEVRCHNVSLNGGLWWVVAPSGKRRE